MSFSLFFSFLFVQLKKWLLHLYSHCHLLLVQSQFSLLKLEKPSIESEETQRSLTWWQTGITHCMWLKLAKRVLNFSYCKVIYFFLCRQRFVISSSALCDVRLFYSSLYFFQIKGVVQGLKEWVMSHENKRKTEGFVQCK